MSEILSSYDYFFYALAHRMIWFETDATGAIRIVGIERSTLPDDASEVFGLSAEYPMVYVYKALSILLRPPVSVIYEAKYKQECDRVRADMRKQQASGQVYLEEI